MQYKVSNHFEKNKSLIVSKNDSILYIADISVRALNVLRYNKIETIEELMLMDTEELMKFRRCGRKTVNEINEFRESLILKD